MAKTKVKTSASAELEREYVNSSAMPPMVSTMIRCRRKGTTRVTIVSMHLEFAALG